MRTTTLNDLFRVFWLIAALVGGTESSAQVVIGAARPAVREPSSAVVAQPAGPGAFATLTSALGRAGPLVKFGNAAIRSTTIYSFAYGDGFLRLPGEPLNSNLQTLTESLGLELGTTWKINASVSYANYSSRLLDDSYNSSIGVSGHWSRGAWTFDLHESYTSNSATIVETGGQTAEYSTLSSAAATFHATARTSFEADISLNDRHAAPSAPNPYWTDSDWLQIIGTFWAHYKVSQRSTVSLGVIAGYDQIRADADMQYTRPEARLVWHPTDKLSTSFTGGVEHRTTKGRFGITSDNLVYNGSIEYSPTMTTTLTFSANQSVSLSYFNNQRTKLTYATGGISQRLLGRLFLTANASAGRTRYAASSTQVIVNRLDHYRSFDLGVSTAFLSRATAAIGYQLSDNSSTATIFRFTTHQWTATLAYHF